MNATVTTILAAAPDFLRALASSISLIPGGSWITPALEELLDLGAQLITAGEAGTTELQALTDQIKTMVAQGRDPTQAEWDALRTRSDAAHAKLQSLNT